MLQVSPPLKCVPVSGQSIFRFLLRFSIQEVGLMLLTICVCEDFLATIQWCMTVIPSCRLCRTFDLIDKNLISYRWSHFLAQIWRKERCQLHHICTRTCRFSWFQVLHVLVLSKKHSFRSQLWSVKYRAEKNSWSSRNLMIRQSSGLYQHWQRYLCT